MFETKFQFNRLLESNHGIWKCVI